MSDESKATIAPPAADPNEANRPLLERMLIARAPLFTAGDRMLYGGGLHGFKKCDEPQPERRVRVRVHVPRCECLQLAHGNNVGIGITDVVMYRSEYECLLKSKSVATEAEPERLRQAEAHYESMLLDETRDFMQEFDDSYETLKRAEVAKMLADKHEHAVEARKKALAETRASLPASYHTLFEESLPAISRIELLEELDAPESVTSQERAKMVEASLPAQTAAVAAALRDVLGPEISARNAEIADLRAEVERLRLNQPAGKGK